MTEPHVSGSPWEDAGRTVAEALDHAGAAIVVAADPVAAAEAALGIGRAQARRRRVAIADLVGDVAPLRALVADDDPHGIVDSFQYGVSLNRIARQVAGTSNLFVMPSGTEPVEHGELLRNDRWRRLTSGFREVEALLLLVVPVDADGLAELAAATDGAVVVGDVGGRLPAAIPVLATVAAPSRRTRAIPLPADLETDLAPPADEVLRAPTRLPRTGTPVSAESPEPASRVGAEPPIGEPASAERRAVPRAESREPRARPGWRLAALVGALVVLGGVAALALRQPDEAPAPPPAPVRADTQPAATPAPRDTAPAIVVADPADSALASAWTVPIINANTEAGASLKARDDFRDQPLATWTPVVPAGDSALWYRVTVGTFATREGADSVLRDLRARGLVGASSEGVLRAPYSFLLEDSLPASGAAAAVARWSQRGIPAFTLGRDDGRARIYAGLFETPDQAAALAATMKNAGLAPVLVYRIGRLP